MSWVALSIFVVTVPSSLEGGLISWFLQLEICFAVRDSIEFRFSLGYVLCCTSLPLLILFSPLIPLFHLLSLSFFLVPCNRPRASFPEPVVDSQTFGGGFAGKTHQYQVGTLFSRFFSFLVFFVFSFLVFLFFFFRRFCCIPAF